MNLLFKNTLESYPNARKSGLLKKNQKGVDMKKILLMLSLAVCNLEATHFQSSMSVTPINGQETIEYLVEMQIEKVVDGFSSPQLIASPKMICSQGEPAQILFESEDKAELLSIQVVCDESALQKGIHASVLMKEKGEVVLSFENNIKVPL